MHAVVLKLDFIISFPKNVGDVAVIPHAVYMKRILNGDFHAALVPVRNVSAVLSLPNNASTYFLVHIAVLASIVCAAPWTRQLSTRMVIYYLPYPELNYLRSLETIVTVSVTREKDHAYVVYASIHCLSAKEHTAVKGHFSVLNKRFYVAMCGAVSVVLSIMIFHAKSDAVV